MREAAGLAKDCWLTHRWLAHFYSQHSRFVEAERESLEVIRLDGTNSSAFHNLAFD